MPFKKWIYRIRVYADATFLILKAFFGSLLTGVGINVAFALSISNLEKTVVVAEFPNVSVIFGGRIHKVDGKPARLPDVLSRVLSFGIRLFAHCGGKVYVKGCAEKEWGLNLSGIPSLIRVEVSIFGHSAQKGFNTFSYVSDRQGIYYDGRQATELENLLNSIKSGEWKSDPNLLAFMSDRKSKGVQKYVEFIKDVEVSPSSDDVIVVGQVSGDASITNTLTLVHNNYELAALACKTFPTSTLYYKRHPYEKDLEQTNRILSDFDLIEIDPTASFERLARKFKKVFVNTSGAGLEAALYGCTVYTAGVSFFSHWGFTNDLYGEVPRRRGGLNAEDVYVAFVDSYARYVQLNQGSAQATPITFLTFLNENEDI